MMDWINLVSDTVTQPTESMRFQMASAVVGDDVFGEDPTVNELELFAASLFNKEAALYCPSGTMTNQIALKCHTNAVDELICDKDSHIYQYETSGYAYHSRVGVQLLNGHLGKITDSQIQDAIRPDLDWLPISRIVFIENPTNKGGGGYYTLNEIKDISRVCKENHLKLHMDGARLFNALVESDYTTQDIGPLVDSISICTSKGLGAPVGSLLIGDYNFIKKARKFRKLFGGGMRQAGIIAAGSLYALKHHVDRLKDDNRRAKELGEILTTQNYVKSVKPVHTNIVIFELNNITTKNFIEKLQSQFITASALDEKNMRFVTHMDYTEEMHKRMKSILIHLESII